MNETLAQFELTAKQLSENFHYRCQSIAKSDVGQTLMALFNKIQPSINPSARATEYRRFFQSRCRHYVNAARPPRGCNSSAKSFNRCGLIPLQLAAL